MPPLLLFLVYGVQGNNSVSGYFQAESFKDLTLPSNVTVLSIQAMGPIGAFALNGNGLGFASQYAPGIAPIGGPRAMEELPGISEKGD